MVEVEFLGPINKESLSLKLTNLSQLKEYLSKDEELSGWLAICAVSINDVLVTKLDHPLKDGDKISLLPPVCGG